MLYLSDLKCNSCGEKVGFKLLSTSSEIPNHELMGRIFIDTGKVKIWTEREDVTEQLTGRFDEDWDTDTDLSSF
jgi:hypothetical protein